MKDSFHPYAFTTILFWSIAYVFTRLSLMHFSPLSLGFHRYFIASITLACIGLFQKVPLPDKKDAPLFLCSGASGFFLYMIAFNTGSQTVSASTSSVIIATVPVFTALFSRIFYKEKLKKIQWASIGVSFVGIVYLTMVNGVFSANMGVFWLLAAALLLSSYNLLQRILTKKYSSLQTTTYSIYAGAVMLCIFAPAAFRQLSTAPGIQLFYIIFLGVFSSAIAYLAWAKAFSKAPFTSSVSNYMFLTPLFTTLLGFVIAREIPDIHTLIGGGIILCGLFVYQKANVAP